MGIFWNILLRLFNEGQTLKLCGVSVAKKQYRIANRKCATLYHSALVRWVRHRSPVIAICAMVRSLTHWCQPKIFLFLCHAVHCQTQQTGNDLVIYELTIQPVCEVVRKKSSFFCCYNWLMEVPIDFCHLQLSLLKAHDSL